MTNYPPNSGYSKTEKGEILPDGRHVDPNGNEIPAGVDESTKAQLQELIDGPKVRIIPSYADLLRAAGAGQETLPPKEANAQAKTNPLEDEHASKGKSAK